MSLVGYQVDPGRPLKPFPVKAEEKKFLFPATPEATTMEILSLDQLLEKFTLEAIFKKEITRATSTRDVTNLLLTLFYGSLVTANVQQISPLKMFLRRQVEMALKGLQ